MCFDSNSETLLVIDSSKRSSTQLSSANFEVNLNEPHDVKAVKLESINIPLTWYNIIGTKGSFSIVYSATTYDLNISGRYTGMLSLLSDIKYALDNCGAGLTFTLTQTNNGKVTISAGSNFEIVFSSNRLWDIIGVDSEQTLTGQSSYVCAKCSRLYSLDKFLRLKIEHLNGNVEYIDGTVDGSTFIIQLSNVFDMTFGDIIRLQNDNEKKIIQFESSIRLKNFRVSILNQDNELIDLNNNDWFICVRLYK